MITIYKKKENIPKNSKLVELNDIYFNHHTSQIDVMYDLQQGKIYSEYPVISFDMSSVRAVDDNGEHIFESYEELKEWWEDV